MSLYQQAIYDAKAKNVLNFLHGKGDLNQALVNVKNKVQERYGVDPTENLGTEEVLLRMAARWYKRSTEAISGDPKWPEWRKRFQDQFTSEMLKLLSEELGLTQDELIILTQAGSLRKVWGQ